MLENLEAALDVKFKTPKLLELAMIHASYAAESPQNGLGHNERLEFLGDAVLELVVSEFLYDQFPGEPEGILTNWRSILVNAVQPGEPEGILTNWRSILVNAVQLAKVAKDLQLNEFIQLSRGEAKAEGALKESILANTFEAVVGALYLDQGYKAAKQFIGRVLLAQLDQILITAHEYNPKGYFQEEAQRRLGITPTYEVLEESGPDHTKHFVIGAYLNTELVAKGEGASKQQAQQDAAKQAILAKKW